MRAPRGQPLPVVPLLRAYAAAAPGDAAADAVPGLGPRRRAIRAARDGLLSETFLAGASESDFQATLLRFYEAVTTAPLHGETVSRRAGMLRHGLGHVLRCPDPLPQRLGRCLSADGAYHVPGVGPAFWSAVAQALDPERNPAWLPGVLRGLRRLGFKEGEPAAGYSALMRAYHRLRALQPELTALHVDHFLCLVAAMPGRDLWAEAPEFGPDLPSALREERVRVPLRRRLKERSVALQQARDRLEAALAAGDGPEMGEALAVADPSGHRRSRLAWRRHAELLSLWIGRLWESEHLEEVLRAFWLADPIPGAGLWLPPAVLHLRAADRYFPWDEASRQGFARLDDAADQGEPPWERYRLFNEGVAWLHARHRLHPMEAPAVLAALGRPETDASAARARFAGFCPDTFRFLDELSIHNRRDWMDGQRDRYQFAVRAPLVELCQALAERYVGPVLRQQYGWDLETRARSGKALTSVCKNDYGRSSPYQTELWVTFYRKDRGARRDDAQFFVRLCDGGLSFGVRLGREARDANRLFRKNVQVHAELLYQALTATGAVNECLFGDNEDNDGAARLTNAGDLRTWAIGRTLVAARHLPSDDPLLWGDDLVGDVLLTFDRLVPVYACAVEADPVQLLERRAGLRGPDGSPRGRFGEADFCKATNLREDWLRRARELLELKKQLILQGVPGTGKTHVARALARLLTDGRDEAVRLVQFHPAYSYEEFVEGIKVKSVEVDGRHDVTYPVEDGLLCSFAGEAARSPAAPFVLIVDEINRGNLPRVFGELLYLLEYRDQAVGLPYSRRGFRLPPNLYLLGTMNAADRSVALVDQALRRRFSFLEMPPDARVLADWLAAHPPRSADPDFGGRVVSLFERLNERLRTDLGPQQQVGHSYFMVPDLDEGRLRVVWEHHVRPLLDEYFAAQPQRARAYDLDALLHGDASARPRRGSRAARS